MSRDYFINGESLVLVKGNVNSAIAALTQFGLSDGQIQISLNFNHNPIVVNAWGASVPEEQFMGGSARINMTLVHFDRTVLNTVITESMAGAPAIGQFPRAGARMGNNAARFAAGNHYIGLNIVSPVAGVPWRFLYTHLANPPMIFPLGNERSLVTLNWDAVLYTQDPYGNGTGSNGYPLWDYTLDA